MAVGFIGLGNMGFPTARRLIQENHDVIAFDTRGAALERIVALGAHAASSRRWRRPPASRSAARTVRS